jgi:hypothetical protein
MEGHHEEMLDMVLGVLGDKVADRDEQMQQNSPVKRFWNKGYQAIIIYQRHDKVMNIYKGKVWPTWMIQSPWPDSGDTDDLRTKLDSNVKARGAEHMDKLFVLQGILTPDVDLIANGLMDGDGLSIKGYARRTSPRVVDWCEDDWMTSDQTRLNIVIVDFYEGCSMVPALLNYNRKK